jgi:hypothetical protein
MAVYFATTSGRHARPAVGAIAPVGNVVHDAGVETTPVSASEEASGWGVGRWAASAVATRIAAAATVFDTESGSTAASMAEESAACGASRRDGAISGTRIYHRTLRKTE